MNPQIASQIHPDIDPSQFLNVEAAKALIHENGEGGAHTIIVGPGICGCDVSLERIHAAIEAMGGAYLAEHRSYGGCMNHRLAVFLASEGRWHFIETH